MDFVASLKALSLSSSSLDYPDEKESDEVELIPSLRSAMVAKIFDSDS